MKRLGVRNRKWVLCLAVLFLGASGTVLLDQEAAAQTAESLEEAFVRVASSVGPSVVSIGTVHTVRPRRSYYGSPFGRDPSDEFFDEFFREFFGEAPEYRQRGLGSGVIVDPNGYILTNQHVIEGADKISVTLPDGRELEGTVKGMDPRSDLAIIHIGAKNLPFAKL